MYAAIYIDRNQLVHSIGPLSLLSFLDKSEPNTIKDNACMHFKINLLALFKIIEVNSYIYIQDI